MATPLTPGSAPVVSEFLEQAPSITREILEGYLKCRTKAHLKLRGEHGTKSDYEVLAVETCAELRIRAAEKLASKYKPEHVMRGVTIAETVLRSGAEVILGSTVEFDDLSLCCDALKKAKGQSRLGGIITSLSWSTRARRFGQSRSGSFRSSGWQWERRRADTRTSGSSSMGQTWRPAGSASARDWAMRGGLLKRSSFSEGLGNRLG